MVDVEALPTYSDALLREKRAEVVEEIDRNRYVVARGLIGRGRVLANKKIVEGRTVRDAIDALLAKRAEGTPVEVAKVPDPPDGGWLG